MAYIGLFDILGFKSLIRGTPLPELLELFAERWTLELQAATSFVHGPRPSADGMTNEEYLRALIAAASVRVSFLRFSDTVLIYSLDETDQSFGRIVMASNKLLAYGILHGLLLRGAITKGELHVSTDQTLYLGEGLIRAYELEQVQNWCGGIIDDERISIPDVTDELRNTFEVWDLLVQDRIIKEHPAPIKPSGFRQKWCLGWPGYLPRVPMSELETFLKKRVPPDDASCQLKVTNTLEFARSYREWLSQPLNFFGLPGLRLHIREDC